MGRGCGHDVAPGARFCGTCGADTWATEEPEAETGAASTPWPALRRSNRPVPLDKSPTIAMGVTSSFPPPDGSATPPPVPPPPAPAPPPPPSAVDRRTPLILGALVLVLVGAVLALSFKILGSSDGSEDARTTSSATDTTATSPTTDAPPSSTAPPPASTEAPATSAPPSTAPPGTSPPPTSSPVTSRPSLFADELVDVLYGYIAALDVADIDVAYSYVSVELGQRDGWDLESFTTFWTGSVVGAEVVSIDDVSVTTGAVTATVDYALPDGGTSRESIVATFAPAGDAGFLVLVDYEVLDSERI